YVEACGNNGPDTARVRLDDDGVVTVLAGTQSTGQGHATAYAQIVADHLHLPPERVRLVQGDTDLIEPGMGRGGSSSNPGAVGRAGRALSPAAARRWLVRARSSPARSRTLPPMCSRPPPPISNSMTARYASPAPTG